MLLRRASLPSWRGIELALKKLRRTTVKKKIFLAGVCCVGLTLLLASGAVAQDNFVNHGVAGVRGLHGHAVLPPWMIFSNCGAGCTSYNTASGYYVAGSAAADGPGQTLAVGFTAAKNFKFSFALTANTNFTSAGGKIAAYLLNGTTTGGPTTELAKLTQHGTIPDYPTVKTVRWTSTKAVTFKKGNTYFLCETEPTSDVVMLWMLSNSDTSSPFWFQDQNACTGTLTWLNATGDTAPAFEVHAH